MLRNLKADAVQIFKAGLLAVDPREAVKRYLSREGNNLRVGEQVVELSSFNRVWAIGAGKASAAMAQALEEVLEDGISGGMVVVKYGYVAPLKKIKLEEAGHPAPDENGWRATQEMANMVTKLGTDDLVILLISGGGSALMPMPVAGVSLTEKMATTEVLLKSGVSIQEMNAIRKHLSQVKGGQLARLAHPATVVSLILSDVVGDPLDVIASGPTVGDPTTFQDCLEILDRYGLRDKVPASVLTHLEAGAGGEIAETPKPDDPIFKKTSTLLVGTNLQALRAASAEAETLGYSSLILSSMIEGDTGEAARFHTALTREIVKSGYPLKPPTCLVSGGETTVVVRGEGKGGRNQEFALVAALELDGLEGVCLLCGGTDGTDGPTDAAGAVVDGDTVARAQAKGLDPRKYLETNDSYHFFQHLDDLVITGPTNTNVMDLRVVLVGQGAERIRLRHAKA
jgi:hydroxypyruvate reductase